MVLESQEKAQRHRHWSVCTNTHTHTVSQGEARQKRMLMERASRQLNSEREKKTTVRLS